MKKSEMDKLREFVQQSLKDGWRHVPMGLAQLLDTFEVDPELKAKEDREIKVGDFIRITPENGRPFIDQAVKVTEEYVITVHRRQYDRAICKRWFGCPLCGKE